MKDAVDSLLNKPMDRKDFFKHVGAALFIVAGGSMITKTILGVAAGDEQDKVSVGSDYGTVVYGGNKLG